jgi:mono/diheme cytochrome c family protein
MKKILMVFLVLSTSYSAQDYEKGKSLFRNNCASCHNMEKKVVGPALKNVVKNQGEEWTTAWITNNQALRDAGDKHANDIFKEYNGMAMPAYEHLGSDAISNIVSYLTQYNDKKAEAEANKPAPVAGNQPVIVESKGLGALEIVLLCVMGFILLATIGILQYVLKSMINAYRKSKSTETYLLKKIDLSFDELNREFDGFIEDEVNKRVKIKIKTFENDIKDTIKKSFKK